MYIRSIYNHEAGQSDRNPNATVSTEWILASWVYVRVEVWECPATRVDTEFTTYGIKPLLLATLLHTAYWKNRLKNILVSKLNNVMYRPCYLTFYRLFTAFFISSENHFLPF